MQWSEFRYWPQEQRWEGEYAGREFSIAGGADGPEPKWVALAECLLPELDALTRDASRYLRAFLNPAAYGRTEWVLERVEIGWRRAQSDEFELHLKIEGERDNDGDMYGWWGVRFRAGIKKHDPVQFRRTQC
jgi:hypothetical protein